MNENTFSDDINSRIKKIGVSHLMSDAGALHLFLKSILRLIDNSLFCDACKT